MGVELKLGKDKIIKGNDREGNNIFYNTKTGEQGTLFCIEGNLMVYKGDLYSKKTVEYRLFKEIFTNKGVLGEFK
jgi:hypothetical protein